MIRRAGCSPRTLLALGPALAHLGGRESQSGLALSWTSRPPDGPGIPQQLLSSLCLLHLSSHRAGGVALEHLGLCSYPFPLLWSVTIGHWDTQGSSWSLPACVPCNYMVALAVPLSSHLPACSPQTSPSPESAALPRTSYKFVWQFFKYPSTVNMVFADESPSMNLNYNYLFKQWKCPWKLLRNDRQDRT